jgi:hypothetical protein
VTECDLSDDIDFTGGDRDNQKSLAKHGIWDKVDDLFGNASKFWAESPRCLARRDCCGGASSDVLEKILSGFGKVNGYNRHLTLCIGWPALTGPFTSLTNQRENWVFFNL